MTPLFSKKSAPSLAHEKIYYLKFCKLLVEVGRPVLQDVFDAIHPEANLPSVLSTPKVQNQLRQLQKKKVLYQYQIDILNLARKGSVTSTAFDISLLIVLLRNFCNITSSPADLVWNSEPSTADKSKAADIVRIRLFRNDLFHRANLAVTESDFQKKWVEIIDALIRLGGMTKYEEVIQNIKVGSVDPEMEQHYHELLRSREETERKTEEKLDNLKTGQQDMKQKLDEISESHGYAEIIIKATFKLFAAGAVTLGWVAGCTHFLNRYEDDPEIVIDLVQRAIIPSTFAMGATVVGILRGSIVIKVKVTSLAALDYLWKSYGEGKMEENLQKVIVTDGLIQHAPNGTDGVGISITISEDEYQTARNTLLGDFSVNIKSHSRQSSINLFQKKVMRNNRTDPSLSDKRDTTLSEKEKTGRQNLDEMVEDQVSKQDDLEQDEDRTQMRPMKSATPQPQQRIYYVKLCKLVIEVGRPILQDVLDSIHPPTKLTFVLSTPKVQNELLQLQKKNVLYQSQMNILYPSSGRVSSTNFDICLLIILLRNICNIESPKSAVWKRQPLPTDISQAADIVRICQCRNDLYHRTNMTLTEGDFEKRWVEIKDALIRLGRAAYLWYEEDIQNIKVGSVDPEMEQHYHELLCSREEAERRKEKQFDNLTTWQKVLKHKPEKVQKGTELHEESLSTSNKIDTSQREGKVQGETSGQLGIGWLLGCTFHPLKYFKPTNFSFEFQDKPWRKIKGGWGESTRKKLMSTIKSVHQSFNFPTFNIILTGQVGAGKSSFPNSIESIFYGFVRGTKGSITKEFNMYTFEHNPHIRFFETKSMEPKTSEADIRNILTIVDGHVPNGHKFNWDEEFLSSSSEYIRNPELKDRAHCVALMINAKDIRDDMMHNLKSLQEAVVFQRGIPLIVLLTHVDEFLPEVGDDITKIFHSRSLLELVEKVHSILRLMSRNLIFPVINYSKHVELDDNMDILLLYALRIMVGAAEDYQRKLKDRQLQALGSS